MKNVLQALCIALLILHNNILGLPGSTSRPGPDFIIIGAMKCGTSSLYRWMVQHPQVAKALTKEIHFFDRYYHRGIGWYQHQFPHKLHPKIITGEASPSYLLASFAAK